MHELYAKETCRVNILIDVINEFIIQNRIMAQVDLDFSDKPGELIFIYIFKQPGIVWFVNSVELCREINHLFYI
jgi:hypothetical protein